MAKSDDKHRNDGGRRKVLKAAAAASAVASTVLLPKSWMKPILRTVVVPAHAQTTVVTTSTTATTGTTETTTTGTTMTTTPRPTETTPTTTTPDPLTGACDNVEGPFEPTCVGPISESECDRIEGTYLGNGTTCPG